MWDFLMAARDMNALISLIYSHLVPENNHVPCALINPGGPPKAAIPGLASKVFDQLLSSPFPVGSWSPFFHSQLWIRHQSLVSPNCTWTPLSYGLALACPLLSPWVGLHSSQPLSAKRLFTVSSKEETAPLLIPLQNWPC